MKHLFMLTAVSLHILGHQLGKTHFIVGKPKTAHTITSAPKQTRQIKTHHTSCRAYFSPKDNIKQQLIDLIDQEKKSIKVSVYTFTDKDIALALINAKKRGVAVEVITDGNASRDKFSKISLLKQEGIMVRVYEPQDEGLINNLMHHKFVVFGCNKEDESLLWTGSFNFTKSANARNQENVIVLQDEAIIDQYVTQFEQLKKMIMTPSHAKESIKQEVHQVSLKKRQTRKNKLT